MSIPLHIDSCTASAPPSPEELAGPAAAARMAQPEDGAGGPDSPGLVIPGESPDEDKEGTSEGQTLLVSPFGKSRVVFVPLPKPDGNPYAAITDYLNVTFPFSVSPEAVQGFFDRFSAVAGGIFGGMTDLGRGKYGYTQSFAFDRGKVLFAYGGQRGTALLSLPGEGCAFITDWPKVVQFLRDELHARITRWDGAVDDFPGVHSVDEAVSLYLQRGFTSGGRTPKCAQAGNWIEPDGSGRTFYVGKRKNGKLLRVYEKGKQLGEPFSPWVRWELELHNIDRIIPWDVLIEPGKYVAGSYPCMRWVQEEASRIRTVKAQDAISYKRLTELGAVAYGQLVNVMMAREGSAERVIQILRREGVPRRLQFTDDYLRLQGKPDAV